MGNDLGIELRSGNVWMVLCAIEWILTTVSILLLLYLFLEKLPILLILRETLISWIWFSLWTASGYYSTGRGRLWPHFSHRPAVLVMAGPKLSKNHFQLLAYSGYNLRSLIPVLTLAWDKKWHHRSSTSKMLSLIQNSPPNNLSKCYESTKKDVSFRRCFPLLLVFRSGCRECTMECRVGVESGISYHRLGRSV